MWPSFLTFAKEITLQIDLASAAIAIIALLFSIWSFRNQRRINVETIRIQRDNDVIHWGNATIDTIVRIEFLLRDGTRYIDARVYSIRRDELLMQLSAAIDKGRLYFPNIDHDTYGTDKEAAYRGHRLPILDRLIEIYDLVNNADPQNNAALNQAKQEVLNKKRAFVSEAQSEVEPRRRVMFLKSGG
jgi:hypothetical protein